MFTLFSSLWNWMPSPLPLVCSGVCTAFMLIVFAKMLKLLLDLINEVIGFVKKLLFAWGIGL